MPAGQIPYQEFITRFWGYLKLALETMIDSQWDSVSRGRSLGKSCFRNPGQLKPIECTRVRLDPEQHTISDITSPQFLLSFFVVYCVSTALLSFYLYLSITPFLPLEQDIDTHTPRGHW